MVAPRPPGGVATVRRGTSWLAWSATAAAILITSASLGFLVVLNGGESPFPALFHTPGGRLTVLPALTGTVLVTVTALVGGLIASRRPRNPVGWFLCIGALLAASFYCIYQYAAAAWLTRSGALPAATVAAWVAHWLWVAAFGLLISVFLFFPDGRLPSRRWRPAAWVIGVVVAVLVLGFAFAPGQLGAFPVDNPVGVAVMAGLASWTALLSSLVWPGVVVTAVASVVLRYRRADGVERQQIKYLVVAAVLLPAAVVVYQLDVLAWPAPMVLLILAMTAVPVAVGLAMLRYRLYEVDRVISRTVTYTLLTGLLAGTYLVAVFGLQQIVRPLTGDSQLAVAGATLAVAALFHPARRRIQVLVDRRFNRVRYDAERTIEGFRARLRDEVDLDQLSADLRHAVRATVAPARVAVWLRPPRAGSGERAQASTRTAAPGSRTSTSARAYAPTASPTPPWKVGNA